MSKNLEWKFEPHPPMGGATGSAFRNSLQGTGTAEEELAREAIQNSCDATMEGKVPQIKFRVVEIEGKQRTNFANALRLEADLGPRLKSLNLPKNNWLTRQKEPLRLTYVEDYGTTGIFGAPHDATSRFHRLLLSIGDASKASEAGTGGSYGYGKSALAQNSRLNIIVAYSYFPKDETGATARLMGCGYYDSHEWKSERYTGRAFFGVPAPKEVTSPLQDAEAHAMAELLGFARRSGDQYGTSLLLVDSDVDADALQRSIEDWWWPRLEDKQLAVEIQVGDEEKARHPEPRKRKDLEPFLDCYALAQNVALEVGSHQKRDKLNAFKEFELGTFGFQILTEDQSKALEDHAKKVQSETTRLGSIALMRNPRMVVSYERLGRDTPPAVGVFLADDQVDSILKLSEPPSHDSWEAESARLQLAEPDVETARGVVRAVKSRLQARMQKLQQQQEPPRNEQERRMTQLERILGSVFKIGETKEKGIRESDVVEVAYRTGPKVNRDGSSLRLEARLAVKLRDDADFDQADAVLNLRAPVLYDEEGHEGKGKEKETVPLEIKPVSSSKKHFEPYANGVDGAACALNLAKDRWVEVDVASEPYDARWVTKLEVRVRNKGGKT